MKATRKLLAAVLAIVMIVCILPMTVSAAENVHVLDAKEHLTAMPEKTKADGDTQVVGQDDYFTIHFSEKTKIDESEKKFEDGYESNQRLNFAGKAQVKPNGTTKNVVEFTTEGPAKVKIWWVQGGDDNRQMGIFNAEGELLTQTDVTLEKNKPCVSTLEIAAAGKYFLGGVTNKNYIFKIEVTVSVEEEAPAAPEQLAFVTAPVDGTAYKLGVTQVNANKTVYLTGQMDGYYYGTTENIEEAADVYVENVEGGFKMYILVEGAKNYINIFTSGKYTNVEFSAENAKVFAYNPECKNLVTNVDGTDFYLGCYKEYTTISASKTSYINAENTCVSQFPAGLVAVEAPEEPVTPPSSDDTGDMIGVVVAMLAVSGMGITVLKKKEN